jgi:hypothetical protein
VIIKALNTFAGSLDLGALERLQESNWVEQYPFRLCVRPGQVVEVDDRFYSLASIQNAIRLGYILVGDIPEMSVSLADMSYSGATVAQMAGEDLEAADLVYYDADGKMYKAQADSVGTMVCVGLATSAVVAGSPGVFLVNGSIRSSSAFSFVVGGQASQARSMVFVSETAAGKATQMRSVTSGHVVQLVGYAAAVDILMFRPDDTYLEIA